MNPTSTSAANSPLPPWCWKEMYDMRTAELQHSSFQWYPHPARAAGHDEHCVNYSSPRPQQAPPWDVHHCSREQQHLLVQTMTKRRCIKFSWGELQQYPTQFSCQHAVTEEKRSKVQGHKPAAFVTNLQATFAGSSPKLTTNNRTTATGLKRNIQQEESIILNKNW